MINSVDLKYFIELAHIGHFTRAADRLGITQPALTHAIKKIEGELKTELFTRSKKGVQLTTAGEVLLQASQKLSDDWKQVRESISLQQNQPHGLIRLGCHVSLAQYLLPAFTPQLLKNYPELNLQLKHGLSREITDLVTANLLDVGIAVNPAPHPDLIIKPLFDDRVGLWAAKNCKNLDVLIYDSSLLQTLDLLNKLKKKKWTFPRTLESTSLDVIAQLVVSGSGVGILPQRVIDNIRHHPCELISQSPLFVDKICLIYKNNFRKITRGKVFIEAVTHHCRQ